MNNPPYRRIACRLYDELELLALRGQMVTLVFRSESKSETLQDRITDLFSEADAEFLRTETGRVIRLDALEAVGILDFS